MPMQDAIIRSVRALVPMRVRRLFSQNFRKRVWDFLRPGAELYFEVEKHHDFTDGERAEYVAVAPIICQTPEAAISLIRSIEYLSSRKIPGDIVECGVYKGASMILAARALLQLNDTSRDLWLYDTFEGMPEPTVEDVHYTGHREIDVWEERRRPDGGSNEMRAPISAVRDRVLATGYPTDKIHFVKGLVEDTIPASAPAQIALLRLDTDYYSSTRHELDHLYPRLSQNGVLIIDDYGAYAGSRKAVDEYFVQHGPFLLNRIDAQVRAGVKTDIPA